MKLFKGKDEEAIEHNNKTDTFLLNIYIVLGVVVFFMIATMIYFVYLIFS